jgi:hypothetical protein
VKAPSAEAAIRAAIKEFQVTEPEERKQLAAARRIEIQRRGEAEVGTKFSRR